MSSIGTRIREARLRAEKTQADVAKALSVTRNAVSMWEKDTNHPTGKHLNKLADTLHVPVAWLLTGTHGAKSNGHIDAAIRTSMVPVIGIVAAGVWREGGGLIDAGLGEIPGFLDPRFAGYDCLSWLVEGDSMDTEMPGAKAVYGILYSELGRDPKDGEVVILERQRAGMRELSCKKCVIEDGIYKFRPASRNPIHPAEINMSHPDEDTTVVALAKVVGYFVPID